MTNRPITCDELTDKWLDALAVAKEDEDYEGVNLIEEFLVDLKDIARAQH